MGSQTRRGSQRQQGYHVPHHSSASFGLQEGHSSIPNEPSPYSDLRASPTPMSRSHDGSRYSSSSYDMNDMSISNNYWRSERTTQGYDAGSGHPAYYQNNGQSPARGHIHGQRLLGQEPQGTITQQDLATNLGNMMGPPPGLSCLNHQMSGEIEDRWVYTPCDCLRCIQNNHSIHIRAMTEGHKTSDLQKHIHDDLGKVFGEVVDVVPLTDGNSWPPEYKVRYVYKSLQGLGDEC